jgi:hypothetical protein
VGAYRRTLGIRSSRLRALTGQPPASIEGSQKLGPRNGERIEGAFESWPTQCITRSLAGCVVRTVGANNFRGSTARRRTLTADITIGCPLSFSPRKTDRQTLLLTSLRSLLVSRHPPNLAVSVSVGPIHECCHLAVPAFVVTVNPADRHAVPSARHRGRPGRCPVGVPGPGCRSRNCMPRRSARGRSGWRATAAVPFP